MKLYPEDQEVVLYETGFATDLLQRQPLSEHLSSLVEKLENPTVLALDDKWGSGKSYFLKRWVGAHAIENEGSATTVYFDAFEHDFLSDPLVSLMSVIGDRLSKEQGSSVKEWKSVATKIAKPAFGIALSLATFGAKQQLDELGDAIVDAVSNEAKKVSEQLWQEEKERKEAVSSFKELLSNMTKDGGGSIVIVIDELDRCRPDYALSILEIIKHFFAVPKVHFILGVNGEALENSVKARYGSDIDAEGYLRKFINVSFSLPRVMGASSGEKTVTKYCRQLIDDMGTPQKISNRCVNLLSHISGQSHVSLRDVGKIFSKLALLPDEATNEKLPGGWTDITCLLVVTSVLNPKLHSKLVASEVSCDEIRDFIGAQTVQTKEEIGGDHNPDYVHELAWWLVITLYACGSSTALDEEPLPSWKTKVGDQFDQFGAPRNPKGIPARIQKDWVDLFKT